MRASTLLFAGVLAVCSLALVAAVAPNTPEDGSLAVQHHCMAESLSFTNHLTLDPPFQKNIFHYTCSCNTQVGPFKTTITPHLFDYGSSAEVTFNGVAVNMRTANTGISNLGTARNSPLTHSSELTFGPGLNRIVIGVGCNGLADPDCYYEYVIECHGPAGGFVTGDPQFVGLRGQQYQVHGVAGEIYNIVSDADVQYNSRFVFLHEGACPVVGGKKQKGCFSHPGSYLGELALKTRAGDRIHLTTGKAADGFALVEVNGKELLVGDSVLLADSLGTVTRNSTHVASVTVGNWDFAFENSDMFVNQRVRVLDARKLRSHGLLGQTWREATYPNAVKHIQGSVDDYVIRDQDMFGDNFVYNTFN